MSGHSKWSKIKRSKEISDNQRGKIFTKIGRELAVAVKEGGTDPATNNRLKDIISKAKSNNMPNDSIARAIKKASGELGTINYETVVYEGYGPGGIAVIVECLTDNKNRTAGDVRHAFDKYGGNMGAAGCVSYLFKKKGVIKIRKKLPFNSDDLLMQVIESGAEDFSEDEDVFYVYTLPNNLNKVKEYLEEKYTVLSCETEQIPDMFIEPDENTLAQFEKMTDKLEESDDVQNIYHNIK